jgi:hypothetical protein
MNVSSIAVTAFVILVITIVIAMYIFKTPIIAYHYYDRKPMPVPAPAPAPVSVVATAAPSPRWSEYFVNNPNLIEGNIDSLNQYIGRNLVFPSFNNNNVLASYRASLVPSADTTCAVREKNDDTNSMVTEHSLIYGLKSKCMVLSMLRIEVEQGASVVQYPKALLTFDVSSRSKATKFMEFILLNPLFVEFSMGMHNTIAYVPNLSNFVYESELTSNEVVVQFIPIASGRFFQYPESSAKIKISMSLPTPLQEQNLNIFYLDKMAYAQQNMARDVRIEDSYSSPVKVFDKNFDAYLTKNDLRYEFCNLVNIFFEYKLPPVFTSRFTLAMPSSVMGNNASKAKYWSRDVSETDANFARRILDELMADAAKLTNIDRTRLEALIVKHVEGTSQVYSDELSKVREDLAKNNNLHENNASSFRQIQKPTIIARMVMGRGQNNMFPYETCITEYEPNDDDSTGPLGNIRNNNIFAIAVVPHSPTHFKVVLMTGANDKCTDDNEVAVVVPYKTGAINLCLTVSPTEKILVAHWKYTHSSVMQSSISKKRIFLEPGSKSPIVQNNLYNLFVRDERKSPPVILDDILLHFDKKYVSKVGTVSFGFVEMSKEIYDGL